MKYDFAAIEKKWQDRWEESKPYAAVTGLDQPKFYGLIEFPYPSGAGLHVGHPRPFTAMDIITRKKRMDGLSIRQMWGQRSRGSVGEYQADERAGVARLSWRVSDRKSTRLNSSHNVISRMPSSA